MHHIIVLSAVRNKTHGIISDNLLEQAMTMAVFSQLLWVSVFTLICIHGISLFVTQTFFFLESCSLKARCITDFCPYSPSCQLNNNMCLLEKLSAVYFANVITSFSLRQREEDKVHKVRMGVGNGLRQDVWREFQNRFGDVKMREVYGSTEGNLCFMNHIGKIGTVGRSNFFYRVSTR